MLNEVNYVKSFDWKQFFKIAAGIFLAGVGVSVGVYSEGELWGLILGFGISAVGLALLVIE
ncbi:MAG TPA: hypothetical protein VJG30_04385 [Candidatus Nanoarchaeia archaeon]|nr:hypothetical protein [Candidatus Nanoarchaeia archaeon]